MVQSSKSIADVDVFHELLEDVKKSGKLVKITACFDVESLAAGGLLFKVLKSMELDAEILPDYVPSITELNVRVLGVNIPHTECDACIVFQTSSEACLRSSLTQYPHHLLPNRAFLAGLAPVGSQGNRRDS